MHYDVDRSRTKTQSRLILRGWFSVNSSCLILERLIYHELSGCSGSLSAPYELDSAKLHVQNLSLVPYTS